MMKSTAAVFLVRYGSTVHEHASEADACAAIARNHRRPDEVWSEDANQRQVQEFRFVLEDGRSHLQPTAAPAWPAHRYLYEG